MTSVTKQGPLEQTVAKCSRIFVQIKINNELNKITLECNSKVISFMCKPLVGIKRPRNLEKFEIVTIKPRSPVRILIYRTWAMLLRNYKFL